MPTERPLTAYLSPALSGAKRRSLLHEALIRRSQYALAALNELKKLVSWQSSRLIDFRSFFLLGLLVFSLLSYLTPIAWGQTSVSPANEKVDVQLRTNANSKIIGDIVYAPVKLDGYILFNVTSPITLINRQEGQGESIEQRVELIENALETILKIGDPQSLEVRPGILNGQTAILASDRKVLRQKLIGTVTDLDALFYGIPVADLAEEAAQAIEQALIRAWQEREAAYVKRQAVLAVKLALGILVASGMLISSQRYLKTRWQALKEPEQETQRDRSLLRRTPRQIATRSLDSAEETTSRLDLEQGEFAVQREQLLANKQQQNHRKRILNRNLLLRRLLAFGQVAVWLFGIAFILQLFPDTREYGLFLQDRPVLIVVIWLVLNLCQKGSELFIDYSLENWLEEASLAETTTPRHFLRSSTLATTFKRTTTAFLIILGIYLSLQTLDIPIAPILAGAGIVGFAISFAFQDLIKDIINGFRILWVDAFAIGDVIVVGDISGLVEALTLVYTQLRDFEGRLITIPNSEIRIIQNLTKDWSRVDFTIEISYETNVDRGIEIIQKVAEQMYIEPEWQEQIIEPPELLGVDSLTHSGILIRIWIKTQPLKQWIVSREFRRRLKRAFDHEGISIGMPQQSLSLKQLTNAGHQNKDSAEFGVG